MPKDTAPITPNDFRKQLIDQGITLKEWATERNYNPEYCSRVLTGLVKGTRGIGHQIAVDMGIKADPNANRRLGGGTTPNSTTKEETQS